MKRFRWPYLICLFAITLMIKFNKAKHQEAEVIRTTDLRPNQEAVKENMRTIGRQMLTEFDESADSTNNLFAERDVKILYDGKVALVLRKECFREYSTVDHEIPNPTVIYATLTKDSTIVAKVSGEPKESAAYQYFIHYILQDKQEKENTAFVEKFCTFEQKAKYKAKIKALNER